MRIPVGSIPRTLLIPPGNYTFSIEDLEELTASTGKYMIAARLRSVTPIAGLPHSELFVIGTDGDPGAKDPQTWETSFAAVRFGQMLDAALVEAPADCESAELFALARDHQFDAAVTQETDTGAKDPKYKGQIRNRLQFFEAGVLTSNVAAPAPAAPPAAPRRPAAAPQQRPLPRAAAPTPAAPPVEYEETTHVETTVTATAPAAPPAAPIGRPGARPIPRRA